MEGAGGEGLKFPQEACDIQRQSADREVFVVTHNGIADYQVFLPVAMSPDPIAGKEDEETQPKQDQQKWEQRDPFFARQSGRLLLEREPSKLAGERPTSRDLPLRFER